MSEEYRGSELELAHRQIGDLEAALKFIRDHQEVFYTQSEKLTVYINDTLDRVDRMRAGDTIQ